VPPFQFTAIGPDGEVQRGVIDAPTAGDVIARLQQQGSMPIRAEPQEGRGRAAPAWLSFARDRGGLRKHQVGDVLRDLATMLSAGQDLNNALHDVQAVSSSPRVRRVLSAVRDAVRDGCSLSSAFDRHPASFGRLHIGLVRAGEAGGQLSAALSGLAELLETQRALAAAIQSALIYPALLLVASIGSVWLLLTRVLPQFVPMFEQSGVRLPPSTQALIDLGDFVSVYGGAGALAVLGLGAGARMLLHRTGPRHACDRALHTLLMIGPLRREIAAARFARVFGTLLLNGVPLITAIGIARESMTDMVVIAALREVEASARNGAGICKPLQETRVFPLRTVQLLQLGEKNARLGPMSLRAAEIHEANVRVAMTRLVSLMVPAITVAMGAMIAGILAAVMTAMLGLNDLAGQ